MAPEVGFEPTTNRLTADRSTTELLRSIVWWARKLAVTVTDSRKKYKAVDPSDGYWPFPSISCHQPKLIGVAAGNSLPTPDIERTVPHWKNELMNLRTICEK